MPTGPYVVALPPISPYVLPTTTFEAIINAYGIRMFWAKSHVCACTYGGSVPGSPDPACLTCGGRGYYWDQPLGPFQALLTLVHRGPTPDEPGAITDTDAGLIVNGEPTLTIPFSGAYELQNTVWKEAGLFDLFIEVDAVSRYNAQLQIGGNQQIPYQQNATIAPSGAVTIYDTVNHAVVTGVPYTVSGFTVTPSGYAAGTNFVVDFTAAPTYVGYRVAGMPAHVRPFGQLTHPRRFRLQTLDLWSRATNAAPLPVASGF